MKAVPFVPAVFVVLSTYSLGETHPELGTPDIAHDFDPQTSHFHRRNSEKLGAEYRVLKRGFDTKITPTAPKWCREVT